MARSAKRTKNRPDFCEERALWEQGYQLVAGVDEAGRGPLAGPVVAAAVILPADIKAPWLELVHDSKQLTRQRRELLYAHIREESLAFGFGIVSSEEIDRIGILPATRKAMCEAVRSLSAQPQFLLIDALKLPDLVIAQKGIIKGDCLCLSISAASILAKVERDRIMRDLDEKYPGYGFVRHKGYGTAEHLSKLWRLGPCPVHRRSFLPVRQMQLPVFADEP